MNKIELFYNELQEKAIKMGFESIEIFFKKTLEFSSKVFRGEIEKYQNTEESGISIRGIYKGKIGYYYSERIDKKIIDEALFMIIDNSELIEVKDEMILKDKFEIEENEDYCEPINRKIVIDRMLESEKNLIDNYEQIVDVPYNMFSDIESEIIIMNSYGLKLKQKSSLYYYVLDGLAKKDEISKTSMRIIISRGNIFDISNICKEIGEEVIKLLDAEPVESGEYEIILKNNVASELLDAFSGIFSGEMVEKGISILKDKMNNKIADEALTIVDNPQLNEALIHRSFDDEGSLTKYKELISKGKLVSYLHNSKTSRKLNMENTGNAFRSGIKGMLGVSHTNMYILSGTNTYDQLVSKIKKGIVIIDIQALHSGLSSITGDFSLPAQGYFVENGKITESVDRIMISGNIIDIFDSIKAVGNDLKFYIPNGMGSVGSPSLYIEKMNVSGK